MLGILRAVARPDSGPTCFGLGRLGIPPTSFRRFRSPARNGRTARPNGQGTRQESDTRRCPLLTHILGKRLGAEASNRRSRIHLAQNVRYTLHSDKIHQAKWSIIIGWTLADFKIGSPVSSDGLQGKNTVMSLGQTLEFFKIRPFGVLFSPKKSDS